MNLSAGFAKKVLRGIPVVIQNEIVMKNVLFVCDDLEKSLGKWKFKSSGSHSGHNGIKSISTWLSTDKFNRLLIGIDRPRSKDPEDVSKYVLERFSENELNKLKKDVFPKISLEVEKFFQEFLKTDK